MVENSCQFLKHIFCYDAIKLKKMDVPTWTLFAGPVTYTVLIIAYFYHMHTYLYILEPQPLSQSEVR